MFSCLIEWSSESLVSCSYRLRGTRLRGLSYCHFTLNIPSQRRGQASVSSAICSGKFLFDSFLCHLITLHSVFTFNILITWAHFRNDAYLSRVPVAIIQSWYQREGYIKSMADLIEKELQTFPTPEEVAFRFLLRTLNMMFTI